MTLADVGEKVGDHDYLKADGLIDVASKFRYFRSNTMSDAQIKAVAELNLTMDEFYDAQYPKLSLLYTIPALTVGPIILAASYVKIFTAATMTLLGRLRNFMY